MVGVIASDGCVRFDSSADALYVFDDDIQITEDESSGGSEACLMLSNLSLPVKSVALADDYEASEESEELEEAEDYDLEAPPPEGFEWGVTY